MRRKVSDMRGLLVDVAGLVGLVAGVLVGGALGFVTAYGFNPRSEVTTYVLFLAPTIIVGALGGYLFGRLGSRLAFGKPHRQGSN